MGEKIKHYAVNKMHTVGAAIQKPVPYVRQNKRGYQEQKLAVTRRKYKHQ
jgi:hypothetical protein